MTRRDLIALLGSTAAVGRPGAGWAQQSERVRRVGMLMGTKTWWGAASGSDSGP